MQEHHISISKTARYYTIGEISKEIKTVWFVCHGYAQLAGDFIKEFESLAAPDVLIVAPEGLSRFYTKGFFGPVGATWMTKEDRLNEINDYVNYFQKLYWEIKTKVNAEAEFHILGFSQGCSTICRWIANESPKFKALWLCSGNIPEDLDFEKFRSAIQHDSTYLIVGDDDPLISQKDRMAVEQRIKEHQLSVKIHPFKGAHVLNLQLIQSLIGK